jgi:cytochrome c oxidase subunit 2
MRKSSFRKTAFVLCLLMSVGAWAKASAPESASSTQIVEIDADQYAFSPAEIHVKKGTRVELKVKAVDKAHGLKLSPFPEGSPATGEPGLRFEQTADTGKIKKSETGSLTFVAERPGVYEFKCSIVCGFGHGRMKGKVVVDE